MERLHPIQRQTVSSIALAVAACLAGCNNPQMSATNPFLAPDRVPPPATRVMAPATAQPYYPAAAPTTQNAPAPPTVIAQAQTAATPSSSAPAAATAPAAASPPLAFRNERSVAIPSDDEKLRFPLPSPPPVEQPPPTQPPAAQLAAAAAPQGPVLPAAFHQPAEPQPMPTPTAADNSGGPWRVPQIPQTASPVMQAQYIQPQSQPAQPTPLVAQQTQPAPAPTPMQMPVQLRAVPSPTMPATQPAPSPPPRMRFPSLLEPTTWFTPPPAPAANQQLIGYMVPGPNGTMQMVPLEQFEAAASAPGQPSASVANSDGFRPRGSMK